MCAWLALGNHSLVHGHIASDAFGQGPQILLADQVSELGRTENLAGERCGGSRSHRVLDSRGL